MIRPFTNNDRATYVELSKAFYASSACDHDVPIGNFIATFDQCLTGSPYCHGVMVECDDKVVGFGLLAITYSNEAGGLCVWLEELFILEDYRSRGLGKEFFQYVYDTFPNAARFRLEATATNTRAISLYDRLGYQVLDYVQLIKDSK